MRSPTHHQVPTVASCRLAIVYKNFGAVKGISHIGLGLAARNTAAVLRRAGVRVEVWPCNNGTDLETRLAAVQEQAIRAGEHPISHVVVSAPWIDSTQMQQLVWTYPEVLFALSSHSNVGFLQIDGRGVDILRESYKQALANINFRAAGNCKRYTEWVTRVYGITCHFLPNLYDLATITTHPHRRYVPGSTLRIGCFGATRPMKNLLSSVAAAMEIGKRLNTDAEIWVSSGREDNNMSVVTRTIKAITNDVPRIKLVQNNWETWPEFRATVASMSLLLQPSYSESFNIVTADGIAEGIPSVVSSAIDWVPESWHCDNDDVQSIADVGVRLLFDNFAPQTGLNFLKKYVEHGLVYWKDYLLAQA